VELHPRYVQSAFGIYYIPAGYRFDIANLHICLKSVTFANPLFISIFSARTLQHICCHPGHFASSVTQKSAQEKKKGFVLPSFACIFHLRAEIWVYSDFSTVSLKVAVPATAKQHNREIYNGHCLSRYLYRVRHLVAE
jgi:hypothetical protein